MEIQALHDLFLKSKGIATDTRKIEKGQLFFALRGPAFNGNQFALQALEKGALAAVVDDRSTSGENSRLIHSPNARQALQDLSRYHRQKSKATLLAVTGSNGKTTTKELIHAVLSQKYPTLATAGNRNNSVGVPLTLLNLTVKHRLAVVEMGADRQGEIGRLCAIAAPDLGYISNFGEAHLEGFGGFEGVVKGKSELYDFLRSEDKRAFVNLDDALQVRQSQGLKRFTFGQDSRADVVFRYRKNQAFAELAYRDMAIPSRLVGQYNIPSIAAAVAIGLFFDVELDKIQAAIQAYVPDSNRSEIVDRGGYQIILDAYNANPSSMRASLNAFKAQRGRKWVILGDMAELGDASPKAHQSIVDLLRALGFAQAFLIGNRFYQTHTRGAENVKKFKTYRDFRKNLESRVVNARFILVKGSRSMVLERVLESI